MLLYLFPADKEDPTMVKVHTYSNLRLSNEVVPPLQFLFVSVDVVNHQHGVIVEPTFGQECIEFGRTKVFKKKYIQYLLFKLDLRKYFGYQFPDS